MFNKVKTVIKSLVKGIKKGWVTSTLPEYITKFHNKAIVRLFRFLGGLSVIITLGKVNFSFNVPIYIFYISFFITILFFVYMLGINIIRLIHIIKILRSDELDVRNSPLDRIASLTARILLCGKSICVGGAVGGSVVGAGLALDSSLINTGNEPIFSPQFVGLLKKFLPEGVIKSTSSNSSITSIEIRSILSKLDSNQLDQVGLKDIKNDIVKAKAAKFVDKLIESLNNKFVPDFNYLYDYLNSLNLLELSALFHLIVLSLICLISINIISAVLGNEIINLFKLEKKYPKLSSFLKIRLKFQKYYLIWNFSLLFIICIVTIILDIFVLI